MMQKSNLIIKLRRLLEEELRILDKLDRELRKLPKGKLEIRKSKGIMSCYLYENNKRHSISRRHKNFHAYGRRVFLCRELEFRKFSCEVMNKLLKRLQQKQNSMHSMKGRQTYDRLSDLPESDKIFLSNEEYKWKKQLSATRNEYRPEDMKYKTNSGLLVRSKSERLIANALDKYNVLFVYEPKFFTEGGKVFYPDFVIRKKDGTIIIWEHFGLMNDLEYHKKAIEKIDEYRKAGFVQTGNLICTYEEDLLDDTAIDDIIFRFII